MLGNRLGHGSRRLNDTEILNVPVVTIAKDLQMNNGNVTVERVLLDGFEAVEAPTPAVVTVSNELGEPLSRSSTIQ